MHFALAHFTGQSLRSDSCQGIPTHTAVRGSDVTGRVPMVVIAQKVMLVSRTTSLEELSAVLPTGGRRVRVGGCGKGGCGAGGGAGRGGGF